MAILITGGSTGIGRSVARHFARRGDVVFVNYHADDEAASETAAAIEELGGTAHLLKADVGQPDAVHTMMEEVQARTERLDQIVHCAARAVRSPLLEVDPKLLADCIAVNGLGLISVVREALPVLGPGSVVFYISSRGAEAVVPEYGPLGLPKALGEHIVRYLAAELAPRKIRIYTLSPGAFDTPAYRAAFPDDFRERLAASAKANRMGRALEGSDVGGVIELLCRPEFEMSVGERIALDGGVYL